MNLSISDLLRYRTCPYSFVLSKTAGWSAPSAAMRRGTALHLVLERKLSGEPAELQAAEWANIDSKDHAFVEQGAEALKYWSPGFHVQGTEVPLSFSWSGGIPAQPYLTLVGRLDAIGEDQGLWSVQLKSVGKGQPLANKLEQVRTSPHEIAYHWLAAKAGMSLQGTILITLKELTKAQQAADTPILQVHHLPRTIGFVEQSFYRDIFPDLRDMAALAQTRSVSSAKRDYLSCYGDFGNSLCPAFDHCHNEVPVPALGLIPQEDRYADLGGKS